MSEFMCYNGHLLRAGEFTCPICGEKLSTMDGKTNDELQAEMEEPDEVPE